MKKVFEIFKWSGRLNRIDFIGMFFLAILLTIIAVKIETAVNQLMDSDKIFFSLLFGVYLILAIMRKRLRDINASGLWILTIPLYLFQAIAIRQSPDGLIMTIKFLLAIPFFILLLILFLKKQKEPLETEGNAHV